VEPKANIFDVQGLSVHDGPGCRTLIFMQGCTLNCKWCSNPEGISRKPVLIYNVEKCRLDGNCVSDCTFNAIEIKDNRLVIHRDLCKDCRGYSCLKNCYTKALRVSAKEMSIPDLMKIVQRDRQFWGNGGGITLSGGEPLLQIDFAEGFLKRCYDAYIHTAIETCGNLPWKHYERVLPYLDWIFIDLKNPDTRWHKEGTEAGNELIINNIVRLSRKFKGRLIVRIPVIPGFNDGDDILKRYVAFFRENNISEVNLLPLHHLGREKYRMVGLKYLMDIKNIPLKAEMAKISNVLAESGINCYTGSYTPF